MTFLRRFGADRSANFAIISALLSVPLILAAGLAVDYTRYSASNRHLQELTDAAALAMAVSKEQDAAKLTQIGLDAVEANRDPQRAENVRVVALKVSADDVDLELAGDIPATFMGVAGYGRLPSRTSALAQRAIAGAVEVALILDNTWSMSETDGTGASKIATLKSAASALVTELMRDDDEAVRIGLVPYADYVNVGIENRNAPWLDVAADYVSEPKPRTCEWRDVTTTVCDRYSGWRMCRRTVDGVAEEYRCRDCLASHKETEYKEVCSGGGKGTSYSWFGCVGSRMMGDTRLHNGNSSVKYPGYLGTRHRCPTPILPLTSKKKPLLAAIDEMVINRGTYYRPLTYIPSGLVWGLNMLAPTRPLDDAGEYDERNVKPRKVAILMTDGDNTLRFVARNGKHAAFSSRGVKRQEQLDATNRDTAAICDNMKAENIEIFSIAFMVDNEVAKSVLESCATDAEHYYDATDSAALQAAFSGIGASLRVVRLAR